MKHLQDYIVEQAEVKVDEGATSKSITFDFTDLENAEETLKSLGVTTADAISEAYPEFINLDNPLFLNALNLFDKNDLVSKMNADIKIVPKILEYWKNN